MCKIIANNRRQKSGASHATDEDQHGPADPPVSVMWEEPDKMYPSLKAICTYQRPYFTVTVRNESGVEKKEIFQHTFEPVFGMDVIDAQRAIDTATRLSDELAAQLKLKPKKKVSS